MSSESPMFRVKSLSLPLELIYSIFTFSPEATADLHPIDRLAIQRRVLGHQPSINPECRFLTLFSRDYTFQQARTLVFGNRTKHEIVILLLPNSASRDTHLHLYLTYTFLCAIIYQAYIPSRQEAKTLYWEWKNGLVDQIVKRGYLITEYVVRQLGFQRVLQLINHRWQVEGESLVTVIHSIPYGKMREEVIRSYRAEVEKRRVSRLHSRSSLCTYFSSFFS